MFSFFPQLSKKKIIGKFFIYVFLVRTYDYKILKATEETVSNLISVCVARDRVR